MSTENIGKFGFAKILWLRKAWKWPKALDKIINKLLAENNKESTIFHRLEITFAHYWLPLDWKKSVFVWKSISYTSWERWNALAFEGSHLIYQVFWTLFRHLVTKKFSQSQILPINHKSILIVRLLSRTWIQICQVLLLHRAFESGNFFLAHPVYHWHAD